MIKIYWRNQGNAVADGQVENWYKTQLKLLTVDTDHDIIVTTSAMFNRLRLGILQGDIEDVVEIIWSDDTASFINKNGKFEPVHSDYMVNMDIVFDIFEEQQKLYKENKK